MFILDTDHASLWLRGNPLVKARVAEYQDDIFLTIVTVQELFNGWVSRLNTTTDATVMLDRYANFWQTVEFVRQFPVLNFDAKADECYVQILLQNPALRKKRLRQDLRIAAIALSQDATVLTCNQRDFGQVPGLKIVDWSMVRSSSDL
jgi:tRNA(fMet)-specific endonuclease VapC